MRCDVRKFADERKQGNEKHGSNLSPVIVKETKKYIKNLDAVDHTPIPVVKTGRGKRR